MNSIICFLIMKGISFTKLFQVIYCFIVGAESIGQEFKIL